MDDKRTILVVCLSLAIFLGWNYLAEYMGWIAPRQKLSIDEVHAPKEQTGKFVYPSETSVSKFAPSPGKDVTINTPLYSATIYTGGGIVRSFILKNYKVSLDSDAPLVNLVSADAAQTAPLGLLVNGQPSWSTGEWSFSGEDLTLNSGEEATLTFTGIIDGIKIIRAITFHADTYLMSENILVISENQKYRSVRIGFLIAASPFSTGQYDPTRVAWSVGGSFKEETSVDTLKEKGIQEVGMLNWSGVMSNYFMNVTIPSDTLSYTLKAKVVGDVWRVALERADITVPLSCGISFPVYWWFGPKDRDFLAKAPNDLEDAVDFGMFSIIAKPLLSALAFFYEYTGNWGIAIILLTVCIKIVFWPLTQKSYKSMEQMKKLQPMMQKLREKYANNREALNREMMHLYRTYKVNPAGGCLPLLLQIPVFIGLYQALLNSIELRHASFIYYLPFTHIVWLADLSAADPFFITPLLMGASMFLQQRLTPASGDPTQQKIMMLMPVIFTVMFLNFPSGLVIYWLFNNVLSIIQQWWMLRSK